MDRKKIKGEWIFTSLLVLVCAVLLFAAFGLTKNQSLLTSAGSFPLFIATCCLILSVFIVVEIKKKASVDECEEKPPIINKDIAVLILFMLLYVLALFTLHFRIATLLFLTITIMYFKFSNIRYILLISFTTVYWMVLLFEYAFKTILP